MPKKNQENNLDKYRLSTYSSYEREGISSKLITEKSKEKLKELLETIISQKNTSKSSDDISNIIQDHAIDTPLFNRLTSLCDEMNESTLQYLILAAHNLSKSCLEDGIRKIIFHVEFCKQNRAAIQWYVTNKLPKDNFDINDYTQSRFQRILHEIDLNKGINIGFASQIIRHSGISEQGNNTHNNIGNMFSRNSGYLQDMFLNNSSANTKDKKIYEQLVVKQGNAFKADIVKSIIRIGEEKNEFLKMPLREAVVLLKYEMKNEFGKMNFKEKVMATQFLFEILHFSKTSKKFVKKWKGKTEEMWNALLSGKDITFTNKPILSQKGPGIICTFKSVEDAKKVFPKYTHKDIDYTKGRVHTFPLNSGFENQEYKIICLIEDNFDDTSEKTLKSLITHELFHIYQNHINPAFKLIITLDNLQIEIKRELSARISEAFSYSEGQLDDIAYDVIETLENSQGNQKISSSLSNEQLEDRVQSQVNAIKKITKKLPYHDACITLRDYLYFDRNKIPL